MEPGFYERGRGFAPCAARSEVARRSLEAVELDPLRSQQGHRLNHLDSLLIYNKIQRYRIKTFRRNTSALYALWAGMTWQAGVTRVSTLLG